MMGFHLLILGAVSAFMGSFMTIKSIIHQPFSEELSSTFVGKNPFQVRNDIIQQVEAVLGTVLMGLSLLLVVSGTLLTTSGINSQNIFGLWIDIFVYLFAGGELLMVLLNVSKRISRHMYLPKMVKLHVVLPISQAATN